MTRKLQESRCGLLGLGEGTHFCRSCRTCALTPNAQIRASTARKKAGVFSGHGLLMLNSNSVPGEKGQPRSGPSVPRGRGSL